MTRKSLDAILPEGLLVNRDWLLARGFNKSSVDYFIRSGKLDAVAHGIYRKPGPPLKWENVLYSLGQMGLDVHVGHSSALRFHGYEHFLMVGGVQELQVYCTGKIPAWVDAVSNYSFKKMPRSPFSDGLRLGLEEIPFGTWDWPISYATAERACIELVSTVTSEAEIEQAHLMLQGIATLRPTLLQQLLQECRQIKAKRLFLWMARELAHPWYRYLDQEKIDLGSGKRQVVVGGKLDEEFLITVPKEMFDGEI
jgi:hypothetical protein